MNAPGGRASPGTGSGASIGRWYTARWRRSRRRPLFVVAHLCLLAALVVGGTMAVAAWSSNLPTGNRTMVWDGGYTGLDPSTGRHWFGAAEADALAAELALAVDGTDWCAGWHVHQDVESGRDLTDQGSNLGPDVTARDCAAWVVVEVDYAFTNAGSSREDNARMAVFASDAQVTLAAEDYDTLTLSADDLLHEDLGHNEDDVIANAIATLPLLLADLGRIDPLTVEPVADAGAPGAVRFDDAEGWGGSDAWRANRTTILAGLVVALLGAAGLCLVASPPGPRERPPPPAPAPARSGRHRPPPPI